MKIIAAQESKINTVDFDNLEFGEIFTDHMFVCDYADGKWKTPEILPYQNHSNGSLFKCISLWSSCF